MHKQKMIVVFIGMIDGGNMILLSILGFLLIREALNTIENG